MAASDVEVSSSLDQEEDPLTELPDEDLYNLVQETIHANEVLRNETSMFEKFLKRVDPKDIGIQPAAPSVVQQTIETSHRGLKKRSRSRGPSLDRHLKLTAEQKCDIAQRELEELRDDIQKLKDESEKILDNYKAIMEEAEIRNAEMKKASYEFERDIMKGAVNQRTNKVIAERVTRYFEDKLRSRDTLIEKLRLKNSTLKVQKRKLHMQLKQKEEMGEVLHEVDFNQLKIENQQYLEKIDEKNQDLLRLKLMTTNVQQILNTYKKKLHTLTMESDQLKTEITQRNDLLCRIETENQMVDKDRKAADKLNTRLKQQLADYKVPEVMEYVEERAKLYELNKVVKMWERKVEIARMALQTNKKTWNKLRIAATDDDQTNWMVAQEIA
ncbi:coiled-coil domain-containing protein 113 [Exaiptasia diaphana]|uniref:Cilia- and flagella-associated protein 263 n=1 Tax=Exaiptasia diaphana TaxID=2652724 RepID=A0A913X2A2_EXADI|nr:coiled-coil domain-containing protein 113 [Exaiptasia diaphana]KXJ27320.1 Coiled-coil domain-containing protein 113 [Exaiptasia diaphana]